MPSPITPGEVPGGIYYEDPPKGGGSVYPPGRTGGPGTLAQAAGYAGGGALGSGGAFGLGASPFYKRKLGGFPGFSPMNPSGGFDLSTLGPTAMPLAGGGGGGWGAPGSAQTAQPNSARSWSQRAPGAQAPAPAPGAPPAGPGYDFPELMRRFQTGQLDQHSYVNLLSFLLGGATAPGTIFSPGGTEAGAEARRAEALRTSDAMQQRARLAALSNPNLDQSQRGFGQFWSDVNTAGAISRSNQDYMNQSAMTYEDMLRQLFAGALGYNYDLGRGEQAGIWQRRNQPDQGGGLGELAGGIAGRAIGGWLSPGGWFAGARR